MRAHKNFGIGLSFSLALIVGVFLFSVSKASAAGENYLFFYKSADQSNIESSLSGNVFSSPTGISGLTATSVYAKDGIFGSTPFPFYFNSQQSQAEGKPVYTADYYCTKSGFDFSTSFKAPGDIKVSMTIVAGLTKTAIEDRNHTIPATIQMTSAAEMSSGGNTVAFDYGSNLSLVPAKCLPSNTKTGQKNIGLVNYTHLTSSAQNAWPGVQTTAAAQGPGTVTPSSSAAGDDTSACVANSHTSLEWIMCPLITSISDGATGLNKFVENQLNFSTNEFLPDSGPNDGVYKAWTVIKDISTSVLIVILLIMVFSQALGTGVFEAYTVRKILPRLVIAVIAMQLSWELCIFIINFTDHLGKGLGQLMAAPFGGQGNLDLGSLLKHLSGFWAGATEISLTAALVAGTFLGAVFLPGALLVAFSLILTVLIGLASILFRNIIIIACVIFSPLALLLWVIPSQSMKKYWNLWSDNFTKVLLLFPIMVGIIYGGRIFAWIAGGAANVGFLNLIMILVGFFGPYAVLPKAFKWGGSLMSSGANAIATNGLTKKTREVGKRELQGHLERKQGEMAKSYNPNGPMLGFQRKGRFGIPIPTGRLATRLQSGSVMPTERGRRLTIAKGDKWKAERSDEAKALVDRVYEIAESQGYKGKPASVGAAKQALLDLAGKEGSDADNRAAREAMKKFIDTSSWIELQHNIISDGEQNAGMKMSQLRNWQTLMDNDPQYYGKVLQSRPDVASHLLQYTYNTGKAEDLYPEEFSNIPDIDHTDAPEAAKAQRRSQRNARADSIFQRKRVQRGATLSDADRQIIAINDQMTDPKSFANVAHGFYQQIGFLGSAKNPNRDVEGAERAKKALRERFEEIAASGLRGQEILAEIGKGSAKVDVDIALGGTGDGKLLANVSRVGSTAAGAATAGNGAQTQGNGPVTGNTSASANNASGNGNGNSSGNGGGTGGTQQPSGPTQGGGGGGGPASGGAQAPGSATPSLGKTELKQAFKEAIDESGLGGQPSTASFTTPSGEMRIQHTPTYQAGDTVRTVGGEESGRTIVIPQGTQYQAGDVVHPVEGSERKIVIPPGTGSMDPPKDS